MVMTDDERERWLVIIAETITLQPLEWIRRQITHRYGKVPAVLARAIEQREREIRSEPSIFPPA